MRIPNGVYVDGKSVEFDIVTRRTPRWRVLPRWLCMFGFMWRVEYITLLHEAPPKHSNVVISYEVDNAATTNHTQKGV